MAAADTVRRLRLTPPAVTICDILSRSPGGEYPSIGLSFYPSLPIFPSELPKFYGYPKAKLRVQTAASTG